MTERSQRLQLMLSLYGGAAHSLLDVRDARFARVVDATLEQTPPEQRWFVDYFLASNLPLYPLVTALAAERGDTPEVVQARLYKELSGWVDRLAVVWQKDQATAKGKLVEDDREAETPLGRLKALIGEHLPPDHTDPMFAGYAIAQIRDMRPQMSEWIFALCGLDGKPPQKIDAIARDARKRPSVISQEIQRAIAAAFRDTNNWYNVRDARHISPPAAEPNAPDGVPSVTISIGIRQFAQQFSERPNGLRWVGVANALISARGLNEANTESLRIILTNYSSRLLGIPQWVAPKIYAALEIDEPAEDKPFSKETTVAELLIIAKRTISSGQSRIIEAVIPRIGAKARASSLITYLKACDEETLDRIIDQAPGSGPRALERLWDWLHRVVTLDDQEDSSASVKPVTAEHLEVEAHYQGIDGTTIYEITAIDGDLVAWRSSRGATGIVTRSSFVNLVSSVQFPVSPVDRVAWIHERAEPAPPKTPVSTNAALTPTERYLARLSPSTRKQTNTALKMALKLLQIPQTLEHFAWWNLSTEQAATLRHMILGTGRMATAKLALSAIRQILVYAKVDGRVTEEQSNALIGVLSGNTSQLPRNTRILSPDEQRELLRVCLNDLTLAGARDAAIIATMLSTPLRTGILRSLDVEDVDLEAGCISGVHHTPVDELTEIVQLPESTRSYLRAWVSRRGSHPGALFVLIESASEVQITRRLDAAMFSAICARRGAEAGIGLISAEDCWSTFQHTTSQPLEQSLTISRNRVRS